MRHSEYGALFAAVSAIALLSSGVVFAQTPTDIRIGAEVRGRLEEGDARTRGGDAYRYDDYRVQLRAGQRLQAELRSSDFDAYLEVYAEGRTSGDSLASDDDGAGSGTNARLRFTPESDGVYIVRARPFSGLETGAYTLALSERVAPRQPRPGRISIGGDVSGRLASGDAEDEDGARFDAYAFRANAGDRVAILLESDVFDPLVRVGRMVNGGFVQAAQNDDGAGKGLNSYLVFTAPQAGEYVIQAASVSGDAEGDYRLSLEQGPPAPQARSIAIGEEVSGRLDEDSAQSDSGAPADLYRFTGRAGQRVAISLKADDFDSFLELFDANHNSLATDDDSGGELNARLTFVLPDDGDYLIEARGFSDATGAYDLKLDEVAPPPPPTAISFGQTVQGDLKEGGATDDAGRLFDGYAFSGTEGQRVQAIMRSGDFDALLQIGKAGEQFEELASDDDGLRQGTDARLTFTLPEDGDYILRALPYSGEGKGLYSLEFADRGPEPGPGSLLVGSTARGSLSEADAMNDEGVSFDAYTFKAKADEKLRFTMISPAFDAFVEVGEDKDGDFRSLAEDDDSLSDTHARLDWTAPRDGTYVVRARSFAPSSTGDYVLTVERQP
ncbi:MULTISPECIES: PPC domain-containing protein [unclassified Brevundimonas]|uniref:PPC domain-containing protein n=1 Tax=unclassified Brevundimonas TaxID=2622653 RepID=UPI0025BBE2B9|nr:MULTISPECIES: PPC domain-containing protein [unclassified Brevundimonas]